MYPTKISVAVLDTLAGWERLNVAAFLASAVAIACPETHGRPLVDATGQGYLPFLREPVLIYAAESPAVLQRVCARARDANLHVGVYPRALLATKGESENHEVMGRAAVADHELAGVVVYGPRAQVDRALKRLKFHV